MLSAAPFRVMPGVFAVALVGVLALEHSAQEVVRPEPGAGPEQVGGAEALVPFVFEGIVLEPDGAPAEGAVVVSSAGGKAVANRDGSFRLEVAVPLDAASVQVTAVSGGGRSLVASTSVALSGASGVTRVEPLVLLQAGECQPDWLPAFGQRPGTEHGVFDITVFDDGSGPALYVGGQFTFAGTVAANNVAKWDGSRWEALGSGTDDYVTALAVFDDGGAPALYAGGPFTSAGGVTAFYIARWDGSSWAAVSGGVSSGSFPHVAVLAVLDDGSGPALYAGGAFEYAGGVLVNNIARWNGSSWAALGSGVGGTVEALTEFDDGSGPALYAGGAFEYAGGVLVNNIARWNGSSWAALGSGMNNSVFSLAVFDDGSGPALYAGGQFTTAGEVGASQVARWNGSSWSALGSGMNNPVYSLAVFDEGGGPALYVGGSFATAGGLAASGIAKWDGANWSALGSGTGTGTGTGNVVALTVLDDGSGSALYVGGVFSTVGGVAASNVAQWDGAGWSPLCAGPNSWVDALTEFDDGGGPRLYAAGDFTHAGDVNTNHVGRWDGSGWTALGSGTNDEVLALCVFDDGGGPALYAGGRFTAAGGMAASRIAKWDGSGWTALGSGTNDEVYALCVFDDGGGPALYAGGLFTAAGGVAASHIAKWDGSSWTALGSGVNSHVFALTVFDDGSGPALFAGGRFRLAGAAAANRIAKWDGSIWTALGSGVTGVNTNVFALAVFDDGSGLALYAGGDFEGAGVGASRIAKWDGSSWTPLGSGMTGIFGPVSVFALCAHDDGSGPALYAGGNFTQAGGQVANYIAKWDGSSWFALGSGMNGPARALLALDDGNVPALYAGGTFDHALDSGDSFLARWGHIPDTTPPTLSCPPFVLVREQLGSPPGEVVTFSPTVADCRDPSPDVVCVPPSGSFFPLGTTVVTCTATDAAGNQATCQFPVTVARIRWR